MTIDNIKSFKEYIKEQEELKNTIIVEDETETKVDYGKRPGQTMYTGSNFTTQAEGKTNDDKIKDLAIKASILKSTAINMISMFKGTTFKDSGRRDMTEAIPIRLLATSMAEIDEVTLGAANMDATSDAINDQKKARKERSSILKKSIRDYVRNNQTNESEDINDETINERFLGFRTSVNDYVNGKSKYNSERAVQYLVKKDTLTNNDKRNEFLGKIKDDYSLRANKVISSRKNEIDNLIKKAEKNIKYWNDNKRYLRQSEDSFISTTSNYLSQAYGSIKYVASLLNTILSDYRKTIINIAARLNKEKSYQDKIDNSHDQKVKEQKTQNFDQAVDNIVKTGSNVIKKVSETGSDALKKVSETGSDALKKTAEVGSKLAGETINAGKNLADKIATKAKIRSEARKEQEKEEGNLKSITDINKLQELLNQAKKEGKFIKAAAIATRIEKVCFKLGTNNIASNTPTTNQKQNHVQPDDETSNEVRTANAVKFAKDFDEQEDEPKNIFDYAIRKAKQHK